MSKINLEMLKIFQQYDDDVNKLIGNVNESNQLICKNDYFDIQELLHDVFLLKNHETTESFKQVIMEKLNEWCENQETIDYLFKM
jgi:hypothetical protein